MNGNLLLLIFSMWLLIRKLKILHYILLKKHVFIGQILSKRSLIAQCMFAHNIQNKHFKGISNAYQKLFVLLLMNNKLIKCISSKTLIFSKLHTRNDSFLAIVHKIWKVFWYMRKKTYYYVFSVFFFWDFFFGGGVAKSCWYLNLNVLYYIKISFSWISEGLLLIALSNKIRRIM